MLNNENIETPVEELELETSEPAVDEALVEAEAEDYKTSAMKTYKNSIAHYDVLIANLKGQATNPNIDPALKMDYESQINEAVSRRAEIQTSLEILERGE